MIKIDNSYTNMQKNQYFEGTSNHEEHNSNSDYWDILLGDLKNSDEWSGKSALDFACGKGRNVINIHNLSSWEKVDGVDISQGNIDHCISEYKDYKSSWYCNNGVDLQEIPSDNYDFVMSTIALQHIPVYEIRRNILEEIYRVLKTEGLFSFQMGYGNNLNDVYGRPRSAYYDNVYSATKTNSEYDVRIQNESEVIDDLTSIGFVNISTEIRDSFSDSGHPQWIYVKCYKK
jgi:ubiquinone/menaquinone biosynthesis C-methylase UbiE